MDLVISFVSAAQAAASSAPCRRSTVPAAESKNDGENRLARMQAGKAMRRDVPRSAHAGWKAQRKGRDPVAILGRSDHDRIAGLVPIRYGRMVHSPFAFLRGSAAVMAFDLARSPATGIRVQACGDCHLLNFGAFATPDRHVIFDINDFDDTLPAPWEWDIKRLAASIVVAGRYRGFAERQCTEAALAAVRSYRERLAEYAGWPRLQAWYARIDAKLVVEIASHAKPVRAAGDDAARSPATLSARLLPKLTEVIDGKRRIKDDPPLVYHPAGDKAFVDRFRAAIRRYRTSLPAECRALLDHYEVLDVAMKVVGVGSVGTLCAVALLQADDNDYVFLQVKQARASVLEPYAGKSAYRNQGERVVVGQRMMHSASDMFLGWSEIGKPPVDIYFRQLRDMKVSVNLDALSIAEFIDYAHYCGWAVARAHARTGDAAAISGYLGGGGVFDHALGRFARAYADQTERDHALLARAVKSGRIRAETGTRR
jgi:uncharacterized protein (DUF2252 family)